ncbi:hypothetical protein PZ897_17160 [Hoeflea sp. YIM 152468]|uniref:hypothetical protein n=1 Tax=Hoeflea sp. YIM 152468 TaxID=3031759 RepID=UPI0023DC9DEE|nr:hypothetical protein [Hoeflea sp. YIM 152468]MDF1609915.1 hypothetical protein [Hoeflea sp. YIM 152468]
MTDFVRLAYVTLAALWVGGCQTASLEDAAPQPVAARADVAADDSKIVRRNPGVTSLIPIEKTEPVEARTFVVTGAQRSGEYPKLGRQPQAANAQLSNAQILAAEMEMTTLLKSRASTPDARAQYERRLRELRELAASHASDTQRQIEN